MRTNIVIDDDLIQKGMNHTGLSTKKDVVDFARFILAGVLQGFKT